MENGRYDKSVKQAVWDSLEPQEDIMRIAVLVGIAGLALVSTRALSQDVSYDYDTEADFSQFKTYAWVQGTNLRDELNHKRIVNAIDAQMAVKGLQKVETGGHPDLLVAYHASFNRKLQINASGWGGYRFGPARSGRATVEEVPIGTLIVDLVNAKTKTIVWRGTATKEVDLRASPEKREKNIQKAAEKLFKKYPPL
jgi:hypothetical protein